MSHQDPIPTIAGAEFDRRGFLDALLAVGFVSTAVGDRLSGLAVPDSAGRAASRRRRARSPARPRRSSRTARTIFKFGSQPGHRRPHRRRRRARVQRRVHAPRLHGAVQADTSQLWCACHNGTYDLGGNVVSGPPPRALEKFVVNLRGEPGDEEIVVSRG